MVLPGGRRPAAAEEGPMSHVRAVARTPLPR
jgi:hypothetical protein